MYGKEENEIPIQRTNSDTSSGLPHTL